MYSSGAMIGRYIEDIIGVKFTGWEGGINQYILNNAEVVFDNLDKIKERAAQTRDGWAGLNDKQLLDLMDYLKELRIAYYDMNTASTSANSQLQYIAIAEDSYFKITNIQKRFIADYINGIKITSDTTEQETNNIRRSIISLTQELSELDNIEIENALTDLYSVQTEEQSVSEYITQFRNALETIQAYCEENGIEVPISISKKEQVVNSLDVQYQRAVDFAKYKFDGYDPTAFFKEHSINTQEEIDAWQKIAQGARDATEAEKEYVHSSTLNEPPIFSTQLTTSGESLNKFQSSVKSAADAYSTLLTGNYTSSELLDSVQAITKAASDMGKSIDWESISASENPLQAIQDTIESVSKSYADNILSGTGIGTDSRLGQILANIVQESYKSEAAMTSLNTQIDSLQCCGQAFL